MTLSRLGGIASFRHGQQNFRRFISTSTKGSEVWRKYSRIRVLYDTDYKIPRAVEERFEGLPLKPCRYRRPLFFPDPSLEAEHQANYDDFTGSGWVRGHQAPAENYSGDYKAWKETFLLTNVCPQNPTMNEGAWREVEREVRDEIAESDTAWIVTGSILDSDDPPRIGNSGVAVPSHLYKVALLKDEEGYRMRAFVMENSAEESSGLESAETTVAKVEKLARLVFFDNDQLDFSSLKTRRD